MPTNKRRMSKGPSRVIGRASFVKTAVTSRRTRTKRDSKVRSNRGYR